MRQNESRLSNLTDQLEFPPSPTSAIMSNDSFLGGGTLINPQNVDFVVIKLREFFRSKGFVEVHTQNRLSILAACEDPSTMTTYNYAGQEWPLPQTGQMWLEYELLKNPEYKGVFSLGISTRNEPKADFVRRHQTFPMLEFEGRGTFEDLVSAHRDLFMTFGFEEKDIVEVEYERAAAHFGVREIGDAEEAALSAYTGGKVNLLSHFPMHTNPFWNMEVDDATGLAMKIDVVGSEETVGSAVRSCRPDVMRECFRTIEDGEYAATLFEKFGEERTMVELEEYLRLPFVIDCVPQHRFGAGIGVIRLIKMLEAHGLMYAMDDVEEAASRVRTVKKIEYDAVASLLRD